MLIVCEGRATEPNYFRSFRPRGLAIIPVGRGPLGVVKRAIREKRSGSADAQVWCVFDRDDVKPEEFTGALRLAEGHGFEIAYSNPAFELWFLLHFTFLDARISRDGYREKLSHHLGRPYEKNDPFLFDELFQWRERAILHAETLLGRYSSPNPERDDPATTVHRLVRELLRRRVS